jgi:sec-independent protein translocase protein TatB
MFDIGWTELLVIAVVLIVVVGPKDLPPMIRAFGKMTANFRKMAGDFRAQFDEALREADMDDVRKTISDAQKLNPTNALRDAINPLRQMGQDIKSDLQKATQVPGSVEGNASNLSATDVEALKAVESAEPVSAAAEVPASVEPAAGKPVVAASPAAATPVAVASSAVTPAPAASQAEVTPAKARAPRKAATKASDDATPAVKPVVKVAKPAAAPKASVAATSDKPKRSPAAPKKAVETASAIPEAPVAKTATRKRAVKKTDTPKDEA